MPPPPGSVTPSSAAPGALTDTGPVTSGFADRYFPAGEEEEAPPAGGEVTAEQSTGDRAEMMAGGYVSSRSAHSDFMSVVNALDATAVMARPDGTILVVPGPETGRPTAYEKVEPWVWREIGGQRLLTSRSGAGGGGA